ncbi:Glycosyltransferase involved in cell wall bisynthesis [Spirosoma endophyticum]|uniref:Glycosyltransferase involved in cell wall bisynthesis n=2 Tax=Spirosoma endophyticum TaxID=662367 RepID=A0A1I1PPJ7_9BACT|nr:Glycosyltransferase involved in cell wall bisynthesis [Spirosoma endophyticum]
MALTRQDTQNSTFSTMSDILNGVSALPFQASRTQSTGTEKPTQLINSDAFKVEPSCSAFDHILCFAHLRWNFVYQRPQHLLSRAARQCKVWYVEEPIWQDTLHLEIRSVAENLCVVVPHLPRDIDEQTAIRLQRQLVNQLIDQQQLTNYITWYYTPMAFPFTDHLRPSLVLYDCMDELSAFLGASPQLIEQEQRLLNRADVVFTGGYSLYEAKQKRHPNVYAFPSCIDYDHFAQARLCPSGAGYDDPADQVAIQGPRIGYSGVVDERLDLALLNELAKQQPDWQFILLGPIVKIDPATLPKGPNLHFLGMKNYKELPAYFSHWDVAMMPFAINEATRFISPTKTPEYLAAGLPVVSTPIRDVVRTYGGWDRVVIADSVSAFQQGIESALQKSLGSDDVALDLFLRKQSWDLTWRHMGRILSNQTVPVTV